MPSTINIIQLGKNKLTDNFIETLKNNFKKHRTVRIKILKSACRNREELTGMKNKILESLGEKYIARIIGFVIVVKKVKK